VVFHNGRYGLGTSIGVSIPEGELSVNTEMEFRDFFPAWDDMDIARTDADPVVEDLLNKIYKSALADFIFKRLLNCSES